MKVKKVLIVSARRNPLNIFSPTVQKALSEHVDAKCSCLVLDSFIGAINALRGEAFDLVITDENIPQQDHRQIVNGLGASLALYVNRFGSKRFAIIAQSNALASFELENINVTHRHHELAYVFTTDQLDDQKMRNGIEMALFGVVHKEDLPKL